MKSRIVFKLVCFVMGCSFMISSVVLAANTNSINPKGKQNSARIEAEDLLELKIPSSWGIIRDSFDAGTDKVIINIQDAHANFEAQENIAKILDRLASTYALKLVTLEGAFGAINTSALSAFPDRELRRDVALYFLKEGKISGAEYLAINSDYGLKLYGVEDFQSYLDNLQSFYRAQDFKQEATQYISTMNKALNEIKPYIYNEELSKINNAKIARQSNKISFSQYVVRLAQLLKEFSLPIDEYPTFVELQEAVEIEQKVDFVKADQERAQLIADLSESLNTKEDLAELVDKSLNFKKGILGSAAYTNFLKDLAFKVRLNLGPYPNFGVYADYINRYEQVANEKLFEEINSIEARLRNTAYTDDDQRQLDRLYRHLDVLNKLVNLTMLTEDIEYFLANRDEINMDEFTGFILSQADKQGIVINLPAEVAYLDVYLPIWAEFYEFANKRDASLVENTLRLMNADNVDYAALVTGGFHTEKLTKILKTKNISYLVVTPRISKHDVAPYLEIMKGRKTNLDNFIEQMQSTLQAMSNLMESDGSMSEEAQQVVENKSQSMKESVIVVSFGRFAAQKVSEGENDVGAIKEAFQNAYTSNMTGDQKKEYTGLIINVLAKIEVEVKTDGVQGVATVSLPNNKETPLIFAYNSQSKRVGQQFAVLDKEPILVPVSTAGAVALAEGVSVLDSIAASPLAIISALLEASVPQADSLVQVLSAVADKVSELATQGVVSVGEIKAALKEVVALNSSMPADKQEQLVNVLTAFVQGVQETKAGATNVGMLSAIVAEAPMVNAAASGIADDLGLSTAQAEKVMPAIQRGVVRVIQAQTPTEKTEAVIQMRAEVNALLGEDVKLVSTQDLTQTIDANVAIASVEASPVLNTAAQGIANDLGLSKTQAEKAMPVIQKAIETVMTAEPQVQTVTMQQLAGEINTILNTQAVSPEQAEQMPQIVGDNINKAVAQGIVADLGLNVAQAEKAMPVIQQGVTKIIQAVTPQAKAEAAKELSANIAKIDTIAFSPEQVASVVKNNAGLADIAATPVVERVAQAVGAELNLSAPQIETVKAGLAQISATPEKRVEVISAMAQTLGVQAPVLSASIDTNIVKAAAEESPMVVNVANSVGAELGLTVSGVDIVKSIVVEIIDAPENKSQIIEANAVKLGFSAEALSGAIDVGILQQTVSVSGSVEVESGLIAQGISPKVAGVLAKAVVAEVASVAGITSIDSFAENALDNSGLDLAGSDIDKGTIKTQLVKALGAIVTNVAIQPVSVSQNKAAVLSDAAANQQAVVIAAQITPQQVGDIRKAIEQKQPEMINKAVTVQGDDQLVKSIQGAVQSAGLEPAEVVVSISAGRYNGEVRVDVTNIGGKSFVSITSMNTDTEKVVKNESDSAVGRKVASVGDALQLGTEWPSINGGIASHLTGTNAEAIEDSGLPIETQETLKDNLGKTKVIVLDARYFVELKGTESGGVKFKLAAVGSEESLSAITEKKSNLQIMMYIPEDMIPEDMKAQGISVDAQDLVNSLGEMGIPVEHITTVIDKKLTSYVSGTDNVSVGTVIEVIDEKFGANNTQVHFAVPQNSVDAKRLESGAVQGVTYTVFKSTLGETEVRVLDYDMPKMLTSMILGKNKELTASDKKAVGAILASIKVDWTQTDFSQWEEFATTELRPIDQTKTVDLDKAFYMVVAFGSEA